MHYFTKKAKNNTSENIEIWTDELTGKMEKLLKEKGRKKKRSNLKHNNKIKINE